MLTENKTGRVEWWWEDALFMVPPSFVRLGVALNNIFSGASRLA